MKFSSYDSLVIFGTVAYYESISIAAKKLYKSKGAISYQIKKLEKNLGFLLFERTNSKLILTDAGRRLWSISRSSFSHIDREIDLLRGKQSETLTIGILTYFLSRWLSPRLSNFFKECPGISLKIEPINTISELSKVNVDLAILWGEAWSDLDHEMLLSMPCTLIGNHEIAKQFNQLSLSEAMQTFPLLNDSSGDHGMRAWHRAAGLEYRPCYTSLNIPDSNANVQAVIDGQGIALWDKLVSPEVDAGKLVYLSNIKIEGFGYNLVYPNNKTMSKAAKQFRNWVIKESK